MSDFKGDVFSLLSSYMKKCREKRKPLLVPSSTILEHGLFLSQPGLIIIAQHCDIIPCRDLYMNQWIGSTSEPFNIRNLIEIHRTITWRTGDWKEADWKITAAFKDICKMWHQVHAWRRECIGNFKIGKRWQGKRQATETPTRRQNNCLSHPDECDRD